MGQVIVRRELDKVSQLPQRRSIRDCKAVDLSGYDGFVCGALLAQHGVEVLRVEPPGGSDIRDVPPFVQGLNGEQYATTWLAYGVNKQAVTLDLQTPAERQELLAIVDDADFLIESSKPGYLTRFGLDASAVLERNPRLIYISITPFGQSGPNAGYAATDLTLAAAAGSLALTGDPDRAPLRVTVPQVHLHAGAEAAAHALIAHRYRQKSGRGQHLDVSMQQAYTQTSQSFLLSHLVGDKPMKRAAGGMSVGGLDFKVIWECVDGFVSVTFYFGSAIGPYTQRLMNWLFEEGACDEATRDKDWINYLVLLTSGAEPVGEFERAKRVLADFLKTRTKAHLFEAALERKLLIAPVATIQDLLESPHLHARSFWLEQAVSEVGLLGTFPSQAARSMEVQQQAPQPVLTRPIPELPSAAPERLSGPEALAGLKVLDLMWVMAGPAATRVLADFGATVVKVESQTHPETGRTLYPFVGGSPGPECSALFQNMNAGKYGLALDFTNPASRKVLEDLVEWADVVAESFTPGTLERIGLPLERIRDINPRAIVLRSSLMGQFGPAARLAGFGTMGAALSGITNLVGWPDRAPTGAFGAYTDYVSPRFAVLAIMAALDRRDQTGEGDCIDLSQLEATLQFLREPILRYSLTGEVASADGNRDRGMVPHGVFPASGEDEWVAIAVRNYHDWKVVVELIESPNQEWLLSLGSLEDRAIHEDQLEDILSGWTRKHTARFIQESLQAHGVPGHAVIDGQGAAHDPHLAFRGHFALVSHPVHGPTFVEGPHVAMSLTSAQVSRGAPTYGEHTDYILRTILAYDDETITNLAITGALA